MNKGDTVKIKNPGLPFQKHIRYVIEKVNKTTLWVSLKEDPKVVYKGIRKGTLTPA